MTFILASASPRRRELLESIRLPFEVIPSHIPEERMPQENAATYVQRLSREKAAAVAAHHPARWIIAADTTVLLGDVLLEKPADPDDACRMLSLIQGKTHRVFTGLTLQNSERAVRSTRVEASDVTILPLSNRDINWYVKTGEPLDKAGAYAVQGVGALFIASVSGSYTNVVGLPLALLFTMLREAGLDPLN